MRYPLIVVVSMLICWTRMRGRQMIDGLASGRCQHSSSTTSSTVTRRSNGYLRHNRNSSKNSRGSSRTSKISSASSFLLSSWRISSCCSSSCTVLTLRWQPAGVAVHQLAVVYRYRLGPALIYHLELVHLLSIISSQMVPIQAYPRHHRLRKQIEQLPQGINIFNAGF